MIPASFLIVAIQRPAFGRLASAPDDKPTSTRIAVIPSENANRYAKPSTPLRVAATQVNTAANAGAPHGAATMPLVAPSANAAGYDPPPNEPAQASSRCGAATGMTSSMASAASSSTFP